MPPKPPIPVPKPVPVTPVVGQVIYLVNRSSIISDNGIATCAAALTTQVQRDYAPLWGTTATVLPIARSGKIPAGAWTLLVLDDSDTAGALGYHDITPDDKPVGKVFAKTDLQYGEKWTVTASHELLEMLGDPNIDKTAVGAQGDEYAYENCDAVENNSYSIDGTVVSDFVTPAWFVISGVGPFDFLKVVSAPFMLAAGGYISIRPPGGQWTQVYGELGHVVHGYESRPKTGSRRERRAIPRHMWLRSRP